MPGITLLSNAGSAGILGPRAESAWSEIRPSPVQSRRRRCRCPSKRRPSRRRRFKGSAPTSPHFVWRVPQSRLNLGCELALAESASCRIVQGFRNHHLAHRFGRAILGQPRAAQATAQLVLQVQKFARSCASRARAGLHRMTAVFADHVDRNRGDARHRLFQLIQFVRRRSSACSPSSFHEGCSL